MNLQKSWEVKSNQKWLEFGFILILVILDLIVIKLELVSHAIYSFVHAIFFIEILFVIWMIRWISAKEFFENKMFQLWVIPIIIIGILSIILLDWNAELVKVYETLFIALLNNQNPYLNPIIYHRLADGSVVYDFFNYLPGEIPIYFLAYSIIKQWNYGIIIIVNLAINIFVVLIFYFQTPDLSWKAKFPYLVLLIVTNLSYSISTTFLLLIIAGIILLKEELNPTIKKRLSLIIAISFGLLTKFFMIPFATVYLWNKIVEKREFSYIIDGIMTLLIVFLFIWPFNWIEVLKNTVLFNLDLQRRGQVTTYYFNPFSALFYILDIRLIYMFISIILFIICIIATRNLHILKRIALISALCLLLFPTPEIQFIGSVFGLLILSKVYELRNSDSTPIMKIPTPSNQKTI